MSKDFESFSELPSLLQDEAIREGEDRLAAQFQAATAADGRALTWGGILIAAATGALGGGLALLAKDQPDYLLALIALCFAAAILFAGDKALSTVTPRRFNLPGNDPSHWLPGAWNCIGSQAEKLASARREQAKDLSESISNNAQRAAQNAKQMRMSFRIARCTIVAAGIVLFIVYALKAAHPYLDSIVSFAKFLWNVIVKGIR